MSLVINSNDNGQLKESAGLITYPDVNQILLKPQIGHFRLGGTDAWGLGEPQNRDRVAVSINGTIINYLCQKLVSPYMFLGSGGNGYGRNGIVTNNAGAYREISMGMDCGFRGGEIVGKNLMRHSRISYGTSSTTPANKLHYAQVLLLHLDGTTTAIGLLGSSSEQAADFSETTTFTNMVTNHKMLSTQTAGVVAQEGDRVIAKVRVPASACCIFGNDGSAYDNANTNVSYTSPIAMTGLMPTPIQVSVD